MTAERITVRTTHLLDAVAPVADAPAAVNEADVDTTAAGSHSRGRTVRCQRPSPGLDLPRSVPLMVPR
jgi:hypothetical protein